MEKRNFWLIIGALNALFSVSAGAFGAHILEGVISINMLSTYETAVRYQMYHAFALIIVALLSKEVQKKMIGFAGYCFLLGIIAFCGSLYLIVITGIQWLGGITPIGGILFVIGWINLVILGLKSNESHDTRSKN